MVQIMDQHHRNHEDETADEAPHDDAAPGGHQVSGAFQDRVAGPHRRAIATIPAKQHACGKDGGPVQIQPVILHEEGGYPVLEQPQRPAIAKIDAGHRQDKERQAHPRNLALGIAASAHRSLARSSAVTEGCSLGESRKYHTHKPIQIRFTGASK